MKVHIQCWVLVICTSISVIYSQAARRNPDIRPLFNPPKPSEKQSKSKPSPIEVWKALNEMNSRSKSASYGPKRPIQHPPVLTRPPVRSRQVTTTPEHRDVEADPASVAYTTAAMAARSSHTPFTTSTTEEPPELEDIISARIVRRLINSFRRPQRQQSKINNMFNRYNSFNRPTYSTNTLKLLSMLDLDEELFGGMENFGFGTGEGNLRPGGVSLEESRSRSPRRRNSPRWNKNSHQTGFRSGYTQQTPRYGTTPEPDDDYPLVTTTYRPPTRTQKVSEDMCFCSPLLSCPSGSVQSTGRCNSFMSLYSHIQFRRCCYQPLYQARG